MNNIKEVPFAPPSIGPEEIEAVTAVLKSGWLSRGPICESFEKEFASYVGADHAVSLSSCTASLHMALLAHGIGPGDEVITTPLTFPATVNAILYTGATPVFVDVREDYNLNPELVRDAITKKTKAIIGVDMHGLPCEIRERENDIFYIQDAAHSVGANSPYGKVGSYADATCFSFYATKNLATGDGGMLTTNNEEIARKVRRLSLHGMDGQAWLRYSPEAQVPWEIPEMGYKCNMSDIQAAIGREQLKKLDWFLDLRLRKAGTYFQELSELAAEKKIVLPPWKQCWHLFAIRISNRDLVAMKLKERGIGVGVHFRGIPSLAAYRHLFEGQDMTKILPVARQISASTLSLPFHVQLLDQDIRRVCEELYEVIQEVENE